MIILPTKFEIFISTNYDDVKRDTKCGKWGGLGSNIGSLKVTGNSVIRLWSYEFLLAFHSNYVPILHRFCDIARYWSKINHRPQLYLAPPLRVIQLKFHPDLLYPKTRVPELS